MSLENGPNLAAGVKSKRLANPYIYGLGMLGLTIPGQMFAMYSPIFYYDKLGMSLRLISLATVFFTIWDAVNDPLMGFLSDRTRTKMGRRRPWLLAGIPLYCIFFILFFSPPALQKDSIPLFLYFTLFLMLTETMSTVTAVNYHALFPELFISSKERASANAYRQALQLVGMIIGISLTPLIIDMISGKDVQKALSFGYSTTSIILVLLGMGFLLISILTSRENREYWTTSTPGVKESIKAVVGNSNFWTVSLTNFFYQATAGILIAGIPFFVKYTLNSTNGADITIITASVFVTAIPFMWFWYALIRKWGTLKVWRISLICLGVSVIPMFFANSVMFAAIAGAFIGIGIAGVTSNIDLINAKIIDEDAAVSGLRREGIYQSAINFIIRLSSLMKSLIFLLISLIFGFVDKDNVGLQAGVACRYMITVFPAALMVLSVVASRFVKFKQDDKSTRLASE